MPRNNLRHGHSTNKIRSTTWITWMNMKQRCLNPNNPKFTIYGRRGIKICNRWLHSFKNFLNDMGEKPGKDWGIDRIDNDGNYEPSNCRWITISENSRKQWIDKRHYGK